MMTGKAWKVQISSDNKNKPFIHTRKDGLKIPLQSWMYQNCTYWALDMSSATFSFYDQLDKSYLSEIA